jgi:glycosyltransferase involved in cell wall biosynthesis
MAILVTSGAGSVAEWRSKYMLGDVLCLSHLRWGFVYQRPNHLMSRCARERRVFFVEEPQFDATRPRLEVSALENGLHLVVPHLPPETPLDAAERAQTGLLAELVDRAKIRDPLLWFYTPMALGYARELRRAAIVYDCMDELSHFRGAPAELGQREQELFSVADVVFTGGHSLYEAKRAHHPNTHAFPSSVDAAHFERARRNPPDPPDQRVIPRPRVGFFGVVDERMDLDLLAAVAARRPDHQLVVLGPVVKIDPACRPKLPNLHWLGPKGYPELPDYVAHWDAAMMPFAKNDATRFISPTKTLEYLAAGKPVISTSIRDVVRPYGERGLVRIADTPGEFVAAIDAVLAERGTAEAAARDAERDELLAHTSWDATWKRMMTVVSDALARRGALRRKRSTRDSARDEEEAPCSTT